MRMIFREKSRLISDTGLQDKISVGQDQLLVMYNNGGSNNDCGGRGHGGSEMAVDSIISSPAAGITHRGDGNCRMTLVNGELNDRIRIGIRDQLLTAAASLNTTSTGFRSIGLDGSRSYIPSRSITPYDNLSRGNAISGGGINNDLMGIGGRVGASFSSGISDIDLLTQYRSNTRLLQQYRDILVGGYPSSSTSEVVGSTSSLRSHNSSTASGGDHGHRSGMNCSDLYVPNLEQYTAAAGNSSTITTNSSSYYGSTMMSNLRNHNAGIDIAAETSEVVGSTSFLGSHNSSSASGGDHGDRSGINCSDLCVSYLEQYAGAAGNSSTNTATPFSYYGSTTMSNLRNHNAGIDIAAELKRRMEDDHGGGDTKPNDGRKPRTPSTSSSKKRHKVSIKKQEEGGDHDMPPRRPLTAYNIFFSDQRNKILEELNCSNGTNEKKEGKRNKGEEEEGEGGYIKGKEIGKAIDGDRPAVMRRSFEPKKTKRPHRKVHGKIGLVELAREVGKRWKSLDKETRAHYDSLAAEHKKCYKEVMVEYKKKKAAQILLCTGSNGNKKQKRACDDGDDKKANGNDGTDSDSNNYCGNDNGEQETESDIRDIIARQHQHHLLGQATNLINHGSSSHVAVVGDPNLITSIGLLNQRYMASDIGSNLRDLQYLRDLKYLRELQNRRALSMIQRSGNNDNAE